MPLEKNRALAGDLDRFKKTVAVLQAAIADRQGRAGFAVDEQHGQWSGPAGNGRLLITLEDQRAVGAAVAQQRRDDRRMRLESIVDRGFDGLRNEIFDRLAGAQPTRLDTDALAVDRNAGAQVAFGSTCLRTSQRKPGFGLRPLPWC